MEEAALGRTSHFGINGFALKLIGMAAMLVNHFQVLFPTLAWLTWVGRLALPIFCFLVAEGFFHTRHFKRYALRLLGFALLSQLPFTLCCYGSVVWDHSNVLFSLLLGLLVIASIDASKGKKALFPLTVLLATALGCALARVMNADGLHMGVLMIVAFYLFRGKRLLQLLSMVAINVLWSYGSFFQLSVFGLSLHIPVQILALVALLPIWLYNGERGPSHRSLQYAFYVFYPAHLFVLWLISRILQ